MNDVSSPGIFSECHLIRMQVFFAGLLNYSPFTLSSPQEVRVGLECAIITFLWVGGQSAIAQLIHVLYTASSHLEFFVVSGMP